MIDLTGCAVKEEFDVEGTKVQGAKARTAESIGTTLPADFINAIILEFQHVLLAADMNIDTVFDPKKSGQLVAAVDVLVQKYQGSETLGTIYMKMTTDGEPALAAPLLTAIIRQNMGTGEFFMELDKDYAWSADQGIKALQPCDETGKIYPATAGLPTAWNFFGGAMFGVFREDKEMKTTRVCNPVTLSMGIIGSERKVFVQDMIARNPLKGMKDEKPIKIVKGVYPITRSVTDFEVE